jgi:cell division protein FtsX
MVGVNMRPTATATEIAAVGTVLGHDACVHGFTYISQQDSYQEFLRMFKSTPSILTTVRASDLPSVYQCRVSTKAAADRFVAQLTGQAGVQQVTSAEVPPLSPTADLPLPTTAPSKAAP